MSTPFSGATQVNGDVEVLFPQGWGSCACDPVAGTVVFKYSQDGINWPSGVVTVGTITSAPYAVNLAQYPNSKTIIITNGLQIWQSQDSGETWSPI